MSGSGFAQFIPLILIFVIFYFFLIRPQQKKIKDHKMMVAALKRGDEVITSGGIIGKIERVLGDDKVDLKISENVTVQIVQSTIQGLLNKPNTPSIEFSQVGPKLLVKSGRLDYRFKNGAAEESLQRTYQTNSSDIVLDLVCYDSVQPCVTFEGTQISSLTFRANVFNAINF